MIDLVNLVPSLEQAMHGSVIFATLAHGVDIAWKRISNFFEERKWRKIDEAYAAEKAIAVNKVEEIIDTVKSKVKKNV